jgi:hypothetical protein
MISPLYERDGWIFPPKAEENKGTAVPQSLRLWPGAQHPVCIQTTTRFENTQLRIYLNLQEG